MMKRMIARLTRLGGLAALVLISHWAWAATPEVFYVHNDQLGTPRAVVDGNNVEVWRWEGDAYGEQPPEQDLGDGPGVCVQPEVSRTVL